MLLRMTSGWVLKDQLSLPVRFNEAGAMLLRMTPVLRTHAHTAHLCIASMRPEQCCSG